MDYRFLERNVLRGVSYIAVPINLSPSLNSLFVCILGKI